MPNPAKAGTLVKTIPWYTKETRLSYGIMAQGSAQMCRKATLVDVRRWS